MNLKKRFFPFVLILSLVSCKQPDSWVQPMYAPITEAIFASGHIEPVEQFQLTSLSEGYLTHSYVKESDLVRTNQILFSLDFETKAVEEQAAKANLSIARQNASPKSPVLQKLRSDLYAARQKANRDSVQYTRLKRLLYTQSVAEVDVENSRLQYETDISNVRAIEENIRATQLSLQQALIQAQSQYDGSYAGNRYYDLRSPRAARVYRIDKKAGELVRKGEAVALLGHPDSLTIILLIDEAGIGKIKQGQQALIELNTDEGTVYEARVSAIYPYFDSDSQSFKAEAMFTNPVSNLIAGTLLQANIIVARKDQALLIPRSCLSPDGKVVVKRNGKEDIISLHTGIVSTEWVEVLSGLSVSDQVLKRF